MATRFPHQPALRSGRWSEAHRIYLVTACCHARRAIFGCLVCGSMVVAELRRSDETGATRSLAWVVMPDHLPWLLELQPENDLYAVVARVTGRSALRINRSRGMVGRIWQPGFHHQALRRDEAVETVGDYLVHDPVRAKLAEAPEHYPLSYAVWRSRKLMQEGL
ncbi:MAG: transposase [Gammaproteobacteria bacterium]